MWDLPGPGLEPMSPAPAGGLSTTAPPGKPYFSALFPLQPCGKATDYISRAAVGTTDLEALFWEMGGCHAPRKVSAPVLLAR